jgi:hypothetical protein
MTNDALNEIYIDLQCYAGAMETAGPCSSHCREATGSRAICGDRTGTAGRLADGASVVALSSAEKGYVILARYSSITRVAERFSRAADAEDRDKPVGAKLINHSVPLCARAVPALHCCSKAMRRSL